MRGNAYLLVVGVALAAGCGGGGKSCSELQAEYEKALTVALACDPNAANQCQQAAMSANSCACEVTVQDPGQANAIVVQLRAQGCTPAQTVACPCPPPVPLTCVASATGGGTCQQPLPPG